MKPGDLVHIYFDGKGSSGEELLGLVLTSFVNPFAKVMKDNNSRWISARLLVDGRVRQADLYHDDDFEVMNETR
jgi:hypothetical protein